MPDWHYGRKFAFAPTEDGSGAVCTIVLDFEYHPIVLAGEEDLVADGGDAPDVRQVFLEAGAMNKLSEALEPPPSMFRAPALSPRKSQPTLKAAATAAAAASRMAQMAQNTTSPRKSTSGDPSSPATEAAAANGNSSPAVSSRDVSEASSPDAPDAQQTQPPPSVARSIIRALTLGPREPSNDERARRGNSSTSGGGGGGGGGGLRLRIALGGKARGAPSDDASAGSPRGASAGRTPQLSPRYDTPPTGAVDSGDTASADGSTAAASTSASLGYVASMESERFRLLPARLTAPLGEVDVLIHAALKHGSDIKRGRRIKAMKLLMRWENVAAATAGQAPLAASASAAAAAAAAGGDIVRDLEVVETAKRLNDHCMCTYGHLVLQFCGYGSITDSLKSDRRATAELLGLSMSDILLWNFGKNDINKPRFIVSHDRMLDAIVIAIQGTISLSQAVTDLQAEYFPLKDGVVHVGMLRAAQWIISNCLGDLKRWLSERRPRRVLCTGHSLGAGTATILTLLLVDRVPELRAASGHADFDLHGYLVAPPPTVSRNLAETYGQYFDSYVNNADIVCRLSYGAFVDFKKMISEAARLVAAKASDLECYQALKAKREELLGHGDETKRLVVPGTIYHFLPMAPPRLRRRERRMAGAVAAVSALSAVSPLQQAPAPPRASTAESDGGRPPSSAASSRASRGAAATGPAGYMSSASELDSEFLADLDGDDGASSSDSDAYDDAANGAVRPPPSPPSAPAPPPPAEVTEPSVLAEATATASPASPPKDGPVALLSQNKQQRRQQAGSLSKNDRPPLYGARRYFSLLPASRGKSAAQAGGPSAPRASVDDEDEAEGDAEADRQAPPPPPQRSQSLGRSQQTRRSRHRDQRRARRAASRGDASNSDASSSSSDDDDDNNATNGRRHKGGLPLPRSRRGAAAARSSRAVVVRRAAPGALDCIALRRGFFMDHMPWAYDEICVDARSWLLAGGGGAAGAVAQQQQ
ncbi:hypothetical protein HK405_006400 [Cladochytrium tenue]|nr:hypothetical protein HK405_006400 [Cladochytrium tenue]